MSDTSQLEQQRHPRGTLFWQLFKISLAVGLAGYVFSTIRLTDIKQLLSSAAPEWLALATLAFVLTTWCLSVRYYLLLRREVSLWQIIGVVLIQNAASSFVAGAAGILSYVGSLRGEHNVSIRLSVASLVIAKVADVVVIDLLLALTSFALRSEIYPLHTPIRILLTGISIGLLLLSLSFLLPKPFVVLGRHLARIFLVKRFIPVRHRIQRLASQLVTVRNKTSVALPLALSFLVSIFMALWVYAMARAFSLPLNFWQILFVSCITQLMTVVPIQVFGGLGIYEITSTFLYGLFGVTQQQSAPFLLAVRVSLYLLNAVLLLYLPLRAGIDHMRLRGVSDQMQKNEPKHP